MMDKPRIFNGTEWITFETQADHDAYVANLAQSPSIDYKQIVFQRIEKGKAVLIEYLTDNSMINLTMDQSIAQLQKFQVVKAFLEVGNIEDSISLITQTTTDEVFTQERKEKYLNMLQQ